MQIFFLTNMVSLSTITLLFSVICFGDIMGRAQLITPTEASEGGDGVRGDAPAGEASLGDKNPFEAVDGSNGVVPPAMDDGPGLPVVPESTLPEDDAIDMKSLFEGSADMQAQPELAQAQPTPEAQAQPLPEAQAPAIPEAQAQPMPEAKAQPTPEAQAQPTPEAQAQPTPEVQAQPTPEAQAQPTPEAQAQPTPEAQAQPTPEAQAQPTPEAQAQPTPEAQAQPTPEAQAQPMPEAQAQPTPEAQAQPTPEAQAQPTPEAQAQPTPEAQAQPTPEAQAQPTPEAQAQPPADPISDPTEPLPINTSAEVESLNAWPSYPADPTAPGDDSGRRRKGGHYKGPHELPETVVMGDQGSEGGLTRIMPMEQ